MKKIDLHIHTIKTVNDSDFEYNIDVLIDYVTNMNLDAIAITNHNIFSREQFEKIESSLNIPVFPGVEVDLEGGHILVIAPNSKIDDFENQCKILEPMIITENDRVTLEEFNKIFSDRNEYLLIPHYDKKPIIKKWVLEELSAEITSGEVKSPNKFILLKKDTEESMVPVLFSDLRIDKSLLNKKKSEKYPLRQTFIEIDEISVSNLKTVLADKSKVFITANKHEEEFPIFSNGTAGSVKLNVVLGNRASGKTYLLNSIYNSHNNETAKYIKQFYISKNSDDESFERMLENSLEDIKMEYLKPLKLLIPEVLKVNVENDNSELDNYLDSLKENANENSRGNAFSKTKIFSESSFSIVSSTKIKKVLEALDVIIQENELETIIEEFVEIKLLKQLYLKLLKNYKKDSLQIKLKSKANTIMDEVKSKLVKKSTIPVIKNVDLYKIAKNSLINNKFNKLISILKKSGEIKELKKEINGFKLVVSKNPFGNVSDLKKGINGNPSIFAEFSNYYLSNSAEFVRVIKNKGVEESELHKTLIDVKVEAQDETGNPVSGGQKAEFILLKQLADAENYDVLLIDEPESSFDNPFIKEKIIEQLRTISERTTVFLATHNNTLGVSISPNKIIYTKRNEDLTYNTYIGSLTSDKLMSANGDEIEIYDELLKVMEAGEDTYLERKRVYENIKNRG